MIVTTIITSLLCAAILFGGFYLARRQVVGSGSSERDKFVAEITEIETKLEDLAQYKDSYVSKKQLDSISAILETSKTDLQKEKSNLQNIEQKLDQAQKTVEVKESHQQELKSAKEEDEAKVEELLAKYSDISTESITLEQKLAASLKNLDVIMAESKLTPVQQSFLNDLSNAMISAGGRLRDLITEAQLVNERLEALKLQHQDLEEEYTKLVEKQLGD